MDFTDIFRYVNLAAGIIMILGGISQFFPISFQSVIVGVYVILFGLATGLLEFRIPDQVARYASFLFSFVGRGIFYVFIGSIILSGSVLRIIAGSMLLIIGAIYIALEFIPSIEPPANMREAQEGNYVEQAALIQMKKSQQNPFRTQTVELELQKLIIGHRHSVPKKLFCSRPSAKENIWREQHFGRCVVQNHKKNHMSIETDPTTIVNIRKECEWRFEASFEKAIEIKLTDGDAEIFGTELAVGRTYRFKGQKLAVFTWHGCTLEVTGKPDSEYTAEETPMYVYANVHFALEKERADSASRHKDGPRVLVLGAENAGKSSLVKILASYAFKQDRSPILVNLDPKEGLLSLPGTLSAAVFSDILDVQTAFGSSTSSGPSPLPSRNPIVYYYGTDDIAENTAHYLRLVSRLGLSTTSKLSNTPSINASGCIIDTAGIIDQKTGYNIIDNVISDFAVNVVVVVGHERLHSDLTRKFYGKGSVRVIKVPKSGGCVEKDPGFVRAQQQDSIRRYFYGEPERVLSPYTTLADFSQMAVYRIGELSTAHSSALPIGHEEDASHSSILKIQSPSVLQSMILAVTHVSLDEPIDSLLETSIMGFIHVYAPQSNHTNQYSGDVDDAKERVKILMPVAGRPPAKALLIGAFRYHE